MASSPPPRAAGAAPPPFATAGEPLLRRRPLSRPPPTSRRPPPSSSRSPLSFPPLPLAGKRRRRHRLLCSWLRPGAYLRTPKSFQGPRCKISFSFLFVFKNCKLVNSFKNRRKIRKIQTRLFWNFCKEIYNFCYLHFFICSIVFALYKIQK